MLNKTAAWLTNDRAAFAHESMGFYLMQQTCVLVTACQAVRYNANLNSAPPRCEATYCGATYTLSHTQTCAYGGNRILRHHMVVRAVHDLARTVLGDGPTRVELEP